MSSQTGKFINGLVNITYSDKMEDKISKAALELINSSDKPTETKEVEKGMNKIVENVTRIKLFYRLNNLGAEGLIKGKFVGHGKSDFGYGEKKIMFLKVDKK